MALLDLTDARGVHRVALPAGGQPGSQRDHRACGDGLLRVSFALILHNHQPVGNFGWVIEDVWQRAYRPMLEALERHAAVRVGLHYSGPLIEWLRVQQPEAMSLIAALVGRGQVEVLGGAWTEPILAALPMADRHGQLVRMADEIEGWVGVRPRGAWLAERVWEPSLAADLADAGYEYTILDDNHLRAAAIPNERMWGSYIVDDQGRKLTVFASEQGLRYTIPWRPVSEVIDHMRANATDDGSRIGVMGDDGEKFGAWPDTFDYCWGPDGWVEAFLAALESNVDWLTTVRPSDWLAQVPPLGRAAIPTTSYLEMTEWALPPDDARTFHQVLAEARARGDAGLPFLRGGTWRAFQTRYMEVNDLHKQMLRTSAKVAAMSAGMARDEATEHLYRGQSNDAYWHGLFGGIYLPDLRTAVLSELIAAEDIADGGCVSLDVADLDLDGRDEVLLTGEGQSLLIDPADGGGLVAWDLRERRVALASVLRRRPEAYHARLTGATVDRSDTSDAVDGVDTGETAVVSPHAVIKAKEAGLVRYLVYDRHDRRGALVHLLDAADAPGLGSVELSAEAFPDLGGFVDGAWEIEHLDVGTLTMRRVAPMAAITKRFAMGGTRSAPTLDVTITVSAPGGGPFELDLEWPFQLLGGGGNPAAWYESDGIRSRHDVAGDVRDATALAFGNDQLGVRIDARFEPAARLTWHPVETISNSEDGFERIYQGSALHIRWPITFGSDDPVESRVSFEVTSAKEGRPVSSVDSGNSHPAD
ncbi:MAG: alpha-amylase/4-alpha-glucanotransferase domain-containing protein [Candidatus Limnocylindrales bacterium]